MSAVSDHAITQDIWIAFSGVCDVRFLKILRPGFRHCFALIREADKWVMVDPMLHKMDVTTTHLPHSFDLPAWLRGRGYRVVRAPHLAPVRRVCVPSPFTCVEAMKRLIGLQDWSVMTPWQLYRAFFNPLPIKEIFIMGSLFTKPDLPSSSYSYTPTPSVTTATTTPTPTGDGTGDAAEKVAAITRRRSLPETIQTSFRGVLQQGNWAPQRKSLLGE